MENRQKSETKPLQRLSVWNGVKLPRFGQLRGDKKTDVLIIGGGICGLLCAYLLQRSGAECILAEGETVAGGVTKNTTAKITSQHGLIYDKLIRSVGVEKAKMYLRANQAALEEYARLCENIDCGFERKAAYAYSLSDRAKIEAEAEAANRLGLPAEFTERTKLPFKTVGAVKFPNQAQFNPLEFVKGICGGLNIYENTFIHSVSPHKAAYDGGTITADKIIIASHFPFINKHGSYFLKLYQSRSYVAAFENAPNLDGMYIDEAENGMSFRNYNNMLFIGGGGHRTGKQGGAWAEIYDFAGKYYPAARAKYSWAAQDCMSLDGIPYIGQYSKHTPDLYVASGFNKWGMTSSMAAAMILSDMVMGKENENAAVFSPQRSMLKPQLFVNGAEAAVNMLTPTPRRCPHLGCALKWNKAEHTWDCACHGSRFENDGTVIDNPAMKSANVK